MLIRNRRKASLAGTESQPVTRSNPQSPIPVRAQRPDKSAGQAFFLSKLPKTGAILLIETAFRANPKKARRVLKQTIYAQIAQSVDIILEGVLLSCADTWNPGKYKRINSGLLLGCSH